MKIDQDRIRDILNADYSHSSWSDIPTREDKRWNLGSYTDFMRRQLSPEARVFDVGCGRGSILMDMCKSFHHGLGIDINPEALRMAEEAKRAEGIKNVDFLLLDYPREIDRLQPKSFDLVYSTRGPIGDTAEQVQAAHHLLRPDGSLFCVELAELFKIEREEIFGDLSPSTKRIRRIDEVRALMEQNGFEVRLAADMISEEYYPDIYAWLQYDCNIRYIFNTPFLEPDDPRIALFAERNTIVKGEIKTTNHCCWVAGVKQ